MSSFEPNNSDDDFDPDALPSDAEPSHGLPEDSSLGMVPGTEREFVVPESASGDRIDLYLTAACDGYSRSQIRQAVQDDGATVNGRIVRPSFKL